MTIQRQLLGRLAATAQNRRPRGRGQIRYVRSTQWWTHSTFDVDGTLIAVEPARRHRQDWVAPDGSGRVVQTATDHPPISVDLPPCARNYVLAGTDQRIAPITGDSDQSSETSSEPAAGVFGEIRAWALLGAVDGEVHGHLLQRLADSPSVTVAGRVHDRLGRPGIAVETTISAVRRPQDRRPNLASTRTKTLVLDLETADVLSYFEDVVSDTGQHPDTQGGSRSTDHYIAIVASGFVTEVGVPKDDSAADCSL